MKRVEEVKSFELINEFDRPDKQIYNSQELARKLINKYSFLITHRYKLDPTDMIFMCVTDDGPGINEEDQKMLFKLFGKIDKTHHQNKKGCGLGLTICKKLINRME